MKRWEGDGPEEFPERDLTTTEWVLTVVCFIVFGIVFCLTL